MISQSFAYQMMLRLDRQWENTNSRPPMRLIHLVRDAILNVEAEGEAHPQRELVPLTYSDATLLLMLVRDSMRRQVEDVQHTSPDYLMHHRELIQMLKAVQQRLE